MLDAPVCEAEIQDGRARGSVAADEIREPLPLGGRRRIGWIRRRQHDVEPRAPFGRIARAVKERGELLQREPEGIPAIAEDQRAAERARAPAAEPDRDARLDGARIDDDAVEAIVRAGIRRLTAAERGAQRAERV